MIKNQQTTEIVKKSRQYLEDDLLNILSRNSMLALTCFVQPITYYDQESYYATYIYGNSLNNIIPYHKLNTRQSYQLINNLVTAVKFLHNLGIAHRDIKPSNIVRGFDDNYYLIDFDAAKIVNQYKNDTILLGTQNYAAPEQFDGQTTFKSDYYALGKTIADVCQYDETINLIVRKLTQHYPSDRVDNLDEILAILNVGYKSDYIPKSRSNTQVVKDISSKRKEMLIKFFFICHI